MSKKSEFFFEGQRLYVTQGKTFEEIAACIDVSERTLRNWADEGNWKEKRRKFLEEQYSFTEDLQRYSQILLKGIMEDEAEGKEVSQSRVRLLNTLLSQMPKIKSYEDQLKTEIMPEEKGKTDISEIIDAVKKEVLGL